ncbi:toprim domain-containing protein [Ruminococcus sp.]|uniref:toprim domain-containing protein n=1 Tax=Ruminococcus sp. TaxID=41978 RepID=UPI003F0D1538
MLKIKEAVIVEGRYDKIKLSSLIDAPIIETNGFRVFSDKEKQNLIRKIADARGILVLTDSDSAGFVIRNFLKGVVDKSKIKHCYIPQIEGKEKRKAQKGKEGILGVEGVSDEVIINAVRKSGVKIIGEKDIGENEIKKSDLFYLGLTGVENADKNRKKLLKHLNMPSYLTTNAMLTALNCLYSIEELKKLLEEIGILLY